MCVINISLIQEVLGNWGGFALNIRELRLRETKFRAVIEGELERIAQHKKIDVVVGVPFYNEKDTIADVVKTAAQGLSPFLNVKPLIVCVGDPAGEEALRTLKGLDIAMPHHEFLLPEGVNGRGFSIRAMMEMARELAADVVLLEADLKRQGDQGFKPTWLERLYFPLLQGYDLISASFRRHYFEDPTGSLFVGPLLETFFGLRVDDPLSGVYSISRALVDQYCTDLDWWYGGMGGYGVDPWLLAQAVVWNKKICQVSLGSKINPPGLSKRAYVFKQVARAVFDCIKANEDYWLRSQLILKRPDIYGLENRDRPPAFECLLEELVTSFAVGQDQYGSLFGHILPDRYSMRLEEIAGAGGLPTELDDQLWATVIYQFLQTYTFDDSVNAEDLYEGLRIIFDGRLAAFVAQINGFSDLIREVKNLDREDLTYEQVHRIMKYQVAEFLNAKSGFIKTWVERAAEVRPVITPLDYLEFIPGVPITLPKDLRGIGGTVIRANTVFQRLAGRYRQHFHHFIHEELGLRADLSAPEIGDGLQEFMTELETVVDSLLPGDLTTTKGTEQVTNQVIDLVPHGTILAVKAKVLRQLLTEFPPPNLLIRMGYSSTAELLSHHDVRDALALAGISEEREYIDRLMWWLGDNLRPDNMEPVQMKALIFTSDTFPGVGELRDISHFDRLAARVTVAKIPKGVGGLFPKIRYLTHIAKILIQAEHFSHIWQVYARERNGFGAKLVNSVIKHRGRRVFSATSIFENWHHRELTQRFLQVAEGLETKGLFKEARLLKLMAKGYGLSLTLGDGTFIPCSAWTWASYSFRGGRGIPTPLSVRIERDWFHHDLLEEIYKEMGLRSRDILHETIKRIGEGRVETSLLHAMLKSPVQDEVVLVQDVDSYPPAGQFKRHPLNPLLEPIKDHWWESRYVLNAATVRLEGKIYVLYRAFGDDEISRVGLAIFDGARLLERLPEPVFGPMIPEESHGCEDPRVVVIDGKLYMVYTAYNGVIAQVAAAVISVDDFLSRRFEKWEHLGLAFPKLWDKDAILFPEKIHGHWVMYHRVEPSIWVSYSDQLKLPWPKQNHKIIIGPRSGLMWDSLKIGSGSQPIKTKYGWLLVYHGVSSTMVYRLGVILVDTDDPGRMLYRSPNPVLSPETTHEVGVEGLTWVPNVVFTCGAVPGTDKEVLDDDDQILCFYGAADTYLCLASATVAELIPESIRRRASRRQNSG